MCNTHNITYRIPCESLLSAVDRFGGGRRLEGVLLSGPADAAEFIADARKRKNAMAIAKFRLRRVRRRR